MLLLKQSTAATVLVGPVLDSAGAAYTGMAIGDFNITKNGTTAAMASAATATHSHNGNYLILFTTGNTDTLGRLAVSCNKSTYAMSVFQYEVLTATTFDGIVTNAAGSTGGLICWGNTLPTTPTANTIDEALVIVDNLAGRINTAAGGGASTITLDASASAVDGRYVGYMVYLYGGTGGGARGTGQERTITAYNGTTKVATVAQAWGTNPDATSKFILYPQPWANVGMWNGTAVPASDTLGYPKVTGKSGTGTGEWSLSAGVVAADAVKISGDSTAADALETMLDGTGGATLYLGGFILDASAGNPVAAFQIIAADNTNAIEITCGATGGNGIVFANPAGTSISMACAGPGISVMSSGSHAIYLSALLNGIYAQGAQHGIYSEGGTGSGIYGFTTSNDPDSAGIYGKATGTNSSGAIFYATGNGDGLKTEVDGSGAPIRGNITGTLSRVTLVDTATALGAAYDAAKTAAPTAAANANAVLDAATSSHQTAGTVGKAISDGASGGGGGSDATAAKEDQIIKQIQAGA